MEERYSEPRLPKRSRFMWAIIVAFTLTLYAIGYMTSLLFRGR
jgi:hypothetical protein